MTGTYKYHSNRIINNTKQKNDIDLLRKISSLHMTSDLDIRIQETEQLMLIKDPEHGSKIFLIDHYLSDKDTLNVYLPEGILLIFVANV